MSLLLTDNASPGSSDGIMPGFLVEKGGMEKLVIAVKGRCHGNQLKSKNWPISFVALPF